MKYVRYLSEISWNRSFLESIVRGHYVYKGALNKKYFNNRIKPAPNSEYALISEVRLTTHEYGICTSEGSGSISMSFASKTGWGAYCRGEFTGGCWSQEEKALHINALELIAATFGVQAFCKDRKVTSVLLKTDNMTVVAYINRMGGTKSPLLAHLAKELWQWCLHGGIHL